VSPRIDGSFQAITGIAAEIACPVITSSAISNPYPVSNRIEVETLITLGHLSDLHATDPSRAGIHALLGKRFFGWLSWRLNRRHHYRREVAEALFDDIKREAPDHVAITGDLTNISLDCEFEIAARMLTKLGSAEWVSLVPGNHDAYVGVPFDRAWGHWADYLRSDALQSDPLQSDALESDAESSGEAPSESAPPPGSAGNSNMFPYPEMFPTVRIRGDLALVGVCTALPTPPFFASGKAGQAQLDRLESTLVSLRARDLCRVVLVHHPVVDDHVSPRRRLRDSAQLRGVLERAGAELVIHGHNHRSEFKSIAAEQGAIPVVGVRSASYAGSNPEKTAQYHIYQIERAEPGASARFRVSFRVRGWDAASRGFVEVGSPRALPLSEG
jgi:3',5'-cyclic AMP phosphodiesterase CpdA